MASQGRKNVHGKTGVRFKAAYTASKEKAMQRNVVTELIVHDQVKVTSGVVKKLVDNAAKLVTLAKRGDLAARRQAASILRDVEVKEGQTALQKLFDEIGPKFKDRNGGYTKTFKLGPRKGDDAEVVLVTWAD